LVTASKSLNTGMIVYFIQSAIRKFMSQENKTLNFKDLYDKANREFEAIAKQDEQESVEQNNIKLSSNRYLQVSDKSLKDQS
jgi:hypothetical protein